MNPNIRDPNIAAGINALAAAFLPNPQAIIAADMARYQKEGIIADTNRTNVDATRLAADRDRLLAEAARTKGYIEADKALAAVLADPAFNPADPVWRAKLASVAVTAEDGLTTAPAGVAGVSTFIDPNFAGGPDAFANVLMGTGIVDDYAKTQPGFAASEAGLTARNAADNTRALDTARIDADATLAANAADNTRALEEARIRAQAEMDRLKYSTTTPLAPGAAGTGGGSQPAPLTVQPGTADKMAEILAGKVAQLYPDAVLDPATMNQMATDATILFQQSRNADAAIAQVLSGLTTTTVGSGFFDGEWEHDKGQYASPVNAPPAAANGTPAAAAPAGASAPPASFLNDPAVIQAAAGVGVTPEVYWTFFTPETQARFLSGGTPAAAAPAAPAPAPAPAPITAVDANGRRVMLDPATNTWVPVGPVLR